MSENKMKDAAYRSPDERLAEKKSKYTPKSIFLNGVLYENQSVPATDHSMDYVYAMQTATLQSSGVQEILTREPFAFRFTSVPSR